MFVTVVLLIQDIFGSQHANLLEEFKSILLTRGTFPGASVPEDAWYSLPVSEIDFSECQQCTPSYRALPDSYPRHVCSERLDWEKEVGIRFAPAVCLCVPCSAYLRALLFPTSGVERHVGERSHWQ